MWLFMIFLFAGIILSLYNRIPRKAAEKSQVFQLWGLILILFAMGVGIGADEEIINSFMTLGVQSVLLAAAAITGSLVVVRLLRPVIQKEKEKIW